MPPRYFTVDEANDQVPQLEELFGRIVRLRSQMRATWARLEKQGFAPKEDEFTVEVEGAPDEVLRERAVFKSLLDLVRGDLGAVLALGCEVKDLDTGLVDWFARTVTGDVLLCWRLGEKEIGWWHDLHGGFAGRRPLAELPPLVTVH